MCRESANSKQYAQKLVHILKRSAFLAKDWVFAQRAEFWPRSLRAGRQQQLTPRPRVMHSAKYSLQARRRPQSRSLKYKFKSCQSPMPKNSETWTSSCFRVSWLLRSSIAGRGDRIIGAWCLGRHKRQSAALRRPTRAKIALFLVV